MIPTQKTSAGALAEPVRQRWPRVAVLVAWVALIVATVGIDEGSGLLALTRFVRWCGASVRIHAVATVLVVAVGIALYALKRYGRVHYGLLEMTFAAAVVWFALGQGTAPPEFVLAELLGGCYVLVRGLDNVEQGLLVSPSRAWTALKRRLWRRPREEEPPN